MKVDPSVQEHLSSIQPAEVRGVNRGEATAAYQPAERSAAKRQEDQVTLSTTAEELKRLYQTLKDLPEVREEKVKAIREAIESGDYEIPEDELIERLMGMVSE